MKKTRRFAPWALLLGLAFLSAALPAADPDLPVSHRRLGLHSNDRMHPNGAFQVEVLVGKQWRPAGFLFFDRFYREQQLELKPEWMAAGSPAVRLSRQGGGAAQIDRVLLDRQPPVRCSVGSRDALARLAAADSDVLDASRGMIRITFAAAGKNPVLALTARIEGLEIADRAFLFPRENPYGRPESVRSFYSYPFRRIAGKGKSADPFAEMQKRPPFFKEYSLTGSGHPSGFTYGWLSHDDSYLYASLDFTADNTRDGNKDYAALLLPTANGIKQFRITEQESRWGQARFVYTPRAGYRHKFYTFRIPRREIAPFIDPNGNLPLAFAAYGTATPGSTRPSVAFDPIRGQYLLVYAKTLSASPYFDIYGRFLDASGTPQGSEFLISSSTNDQLEPVVGFDPFNSRFLVVWMDYYSGSHYDVVGRRVLADGTMPAPEFVISGVTGNQIYPALTLDSVNHRFLVAWQDDRTANKDIYGRIVNPISGFFSTEIILCSNVEDQYSPTVAFEPTQQMYLIAWEDNRNSITTGRDIYGQWVHSDGSLEGVNQVISDATANQTEPAAAADPVNQKFLVSWEDERTGTSDIFRQLVNSSSTGPFLTGLAKNVTPLAASNQLYPTVAYNTSPGRFLLAWVDMRDGGWDIWGQRVIADTDTPLAPFFTIADNANPLYYPSVAANTTCGNFLVVYEDHGSSLYDIGIALVGKPCSLHLPLVQKN